MNELAPLEHYRPMAYAIAREFYLPGADYEDVRQEAMVGLWKAIRDFNGYGSFNAFARMCIRRQLITALKSARREKHLVLTEADRAVELDGDRAELVDTVPDPRADPAELVEQRERLSELLRAVADDLSPLERRALIHVANGYPYAGDKSIDNALQRARRKLADVPPTWQQAAAA